MTRVLRNGILFRWELAGTAFMIIAGSALHFAFDWTGGWKAAGMIAAVNESIWEHLKLAFWPGLVWGFLEAQRLGIPLSKVMAMKGFSLLITSMLIVLIFSSYTSILGRNLLPLDIGIFVLAIIVGQLVSALGLRQKVSSRPVIRVGQALVLLQIAAFSTLTFHPPGHWLFVDSRTGLTGFQPD